LALTDEVIMVAIRDVCADDISMIIDVIQLCPSHARERRKRNIHDRKRALEPNETMVDLRRCCVHVVPHDDASIVNADAEGAIAIPTEVRPPGHRRL